MLIYYPQSLTNAGVFGQGNLDLVREKSGKFQGILLSIICGNPVNQTNKNVALIPKEARESHHTGIGALNGSRNAFDVCIFFISI